MALFDMIFESFTTFIKLKGSGRVSWGKNLFESGIGIVKLFIKFTCIDGINHKLVIYKTTLYSRVTPLSKHLPIVSNFHK